MMGLKTPVIVLNFKAYPEAMGEEGLTLSRIAEGVAEETGASIALCPHPPDLAWIARQVTLPCLSQHVEAREPGSHTGWLLPQGVKAAGGVGTLLNHSEHPMTPADMDALIQKARELDLLTVACTGNIRISASLASLGPDFIAIEPPALIGSGIPVSRADPEIVTRSIEAVQAIDQGIKVLCGAGISTGEDVRAALDLGVEGVLLASGVVKARDPKKALEDLAAGL
jgi:triosephosphate isomerase